MGFLISYRLGAPAGIAARRLVSRLREICVSLPGGEVSELITEAARFESAGSRNELPFAREIEVISAPAESFTYSLEVDASEAIGFWFWPGALCPGAAFGLARYPATIFDPRAGIQVPTRLGSGWHWSAGFSAEPALAIGVAHFLSCHLAIDSLLRSAAELGCVTSVEEESGFWSTRDVRALARLAARSKPEPDDFAPILAVALGRSEGSRQAADDSWILARSLRELATADASAKN